MAASDNVTKIYMDFKPRVRLRGSGIDLPGALPLSGRDLGKGYS